MASLLDEVRSKGDDVSSSLRKVTADMKSKNQAERSSVVMTDDVGGKRTTSSFASRMRTIEDMNKPKGEPTIHKEKDTWIVKFYNSTTSVVEIGSGDDNEGEQTKQTVRISDCSDVTFRVASPKMNSILLCNCQKTNVILNSLISGVEICDCSKIKVQVLGVVPSVAIDKTTGLDLYLSEGSKRVTELTTSKSGEMNVNFPEDGGGKGGEDVEWVEVAIPEQFVHNLDPANKKLNTQVSHLYSC
eukprot:GHVS01032836.1.p1 GENE.GHVS01032836.1~~GHVS01032836.1.p1  ORF type:complete len:244 (+),score=26.61 GHVS01032836.1:375-1106(+)